MERQIRIFLSTPSDVSEERRALAGLVNEINDVVAFLAPEREVRLELVHYETHVYPDVGGPQSVIDRQIPVDYDIHFGIMWKRAGTPTDKADSGTIHEFDRALAHREQNGKPAIMFYFCDEAIDIPTTQHEIDQLAAVVRFRERLSKIGLTASYPDRSEFRERARIGLLRAIADLLREQLPERAPEAATLGEVKIPDDLQALCDRYDAIRRETKPGAARTREMTAILERMKLHATEARGALSELKRSDSAGTRLAAIAVLQAFPERAELAWLAERLDPDLERPFIGYQAASALNQAVRSLPQSACESLKMELRRALELAERNPDDPPRIELLNYAIKEAELKCG